MDTTSVEPLYVTSLEEVVWGALLIAATMAIHGVGMLAVLRVNHWCKIWLATARSPLSGLLLIVATSWMILLLHLSEVILWASFFLWKGAFPNRSVAFYFSLNEYTTLGSDYNLPLHWRLLEGMIAIAGLLAFAWSTGVLFTLAQQFQDEQMQHSRRPHVKMDNDP